MKKHLTHIVTLLFTTVITYGQMNTSDSLKLIITNLNKYIETHPNEFNSYLKRANYEYELSYDKFGYGFEEAALKDYNIAIKLNPQSDTAFNCRGYFYQAFGNDSLAIIDFTKATELNPNYSEAFYNLGFSEYGKKHYEVAITNFTKAIELNNNYESAYYFRAYAKFFIGNQNLSACEDWTKAYKLGSVAAKDNLEKYCK